LRGICNKLNSTFTVEAILSAAGAEAVAGVGALIKSAEDSAPVVVAKYGYIKDICDTI